MRRLTKMRQQNITRHRGSTWTKHESLGNSGKHGRNEVFKNFVHSSTGTRTEWKTASKNAHVRQCKAVTAKICSKMRSARTALFFFSFFFNQR